ncbi:hypothetical protein DSO57_1031453 [Entomophthora muscae]|uniref:Uncharacterized protein n=1 Tax=Entomophthora muscae TaxID=34485 RepID=A0ACC2UKH9_9FUNG|nr:hypothetical protein DSO57_1031453 [Entomophthora muscae]
MSSQPSNVSGTSNSTKGAVKQTGGKVVGSDEMQIKGAAEKAKTQAAKNKGHVKGTRSSVKDTVGGAIGNVTMQAVGRANKDYGEIKRLDKS